LRICLVYDCLFPHTVGGAERWYRNLAERLAAEGHEVTYLTLRQWERSEPPDVPGVRVLAVGPRVGLYTRDGRRRIWPPLLFGAGVLAHLARRGRDYDVVHTASFPYFSLLAAAAVRRRGRYALLVDWHEVWSDAYWREYLGRAGWIGHRVQRRCARVPQRAFCFSRLHAARLVAEGLRGEPTLLEGEYSGTLARPEPEPAGQSVVFAGRHIPEKRVPALVEAMPALRERAPELRLDVFGDGPDRALVERRVSELGLGDVVSVHGFVAAEEVGRALRHAVCMVLPSSREGYGMVVVEAAAMGTPSVVVAAPDNAAVELVDEGENGFIAPSARPEDLAGAIVRARDGGAALRESTADWFERNARRLSMASSLERVVAAYSNSRNSSSIAAR
jgi:glycosyltransferase involved in cell wall biosynthesis